MRAIRNQSPWLEMKKRWFSEERRLGYCDEHQAILDCLVRRDTEGTKNAMQNRRTKSTGAASPRIAAELQQEAAEPATRTPLGSRW